MKMRHYEQATVALQSDNVYPDTHARTGQPIEWPLKKALVVVNGSNATVSVPVYDSGGQRLKMDRFDRLTSIGVSEGKKNGKPVTISGVSSYLLDGGVDPEDAHVTFVVEDWGRCTTC
jgi:hypothetical protein